MKIINLGIRTDGNLINCDNGETIVLTEWWKDYFVKLANQTREYEDQEQNLLHRIDELETMLADERQAKPTSAERIKESAKNPYNPETQPVSHAEWEKAWHKKGKAHKTDLSWEAKNCKNPFSRRSQWWQWNEWRKAHQGADL